MRKLFSFIIILVVLFSFNALVVAVGDSIEIGFEHSTIKAEIGKPVSVNYYISGGNGDFTVKYTWEKYVNERWILVNQPFEMLSASSGTLSYTPDEGTQVRLWMHAEDSTGRVSEGYSATIRVFGDDGVDPIVIDITLDRTELRLGETISATQSVTGGNGQYTLL